MIPGIPWRTTCARKTADRRLGDVLARADVALGTAEGIRGDLGPVLASADSILTHTDQTVVDLRPQLLSLTAGWKVAGGETAQTMRNIQRATPRLLTTWQQIGKDVSGSASNINSLTPLTGKRPAGMTGCSATRSTELCCTETSIPSTTSP